MCCLGLQNKGAPAYCSCSPSDKCEEGAVEVPNCTAAKVVNDCTHFPIIADGELTRAISACTLP